MIIRSIEYAAESCYTTDNAVRDHYCRRCIICCKHISYYYHIAAHLAVGDSRGHVKMRVIEVLTFTRDFLLTCLTQHLFCIDIIT